MGLLTDIKVCKFSAWFTRECSKHAYYLVITGTKAGGWTDRVASILCTVDKSWGKILREQHDTNKTFFFCSLEPVLQDEDKKG